MKSAHSVIPQHGSGNETPAPGNSSFGIAVTISSQFAKKPRQRHIEPFGNERQIKNGNVSPASFNVGEEAAVDANPLRQLILRPSGLLSPAANTITQYREQVGWHS